MNTQRKKDQSQKSYLWCCDQNVSHPPYYKSQYSALHFTLLTSYSATDIHSNFSFVFFEFMLFFLPVVNILNSVKHLVHLIQSSLTVQLADTKISFLPDDLGWNRASKFPVCCSGAQHLSKMVLHSEFLSLTSGFFLKSQYFFLWVNGQGPSLPQRVQEIQVLLQSLCYLGQQNQVVCKEKKFNLVRCKFTALSYSTSLKGSFCFLCSSFN